MKQEALKPRAVSKYLGNYVNKQIAYIFYP